MAYSTCIGSYPRHKETRTCSGCDACGKCDGFKMRHLHCQRCCGRLTACPKCYPEMKAHVDEANSVLV